MNSVSIRFISFRTILNRILIPSSSSSLTASSAALHARLMLLFAASLASLTGLSKPAHAAELGGATLPDSAEVSGKKLRLNGMGLRQATFLNLNVYAAGLYLETLSSSADEILASPQAKQVRMHFLREVDAEKIQNAWSQSFKKNCQSDCEKLKAALERLNTAMQKMAPGESMVLTFLPDRLELTLKSEKAQTIVQNKDKGTEGRDFGKIVLASWLGQEPPNEGLKEGMLGKLKK